MANDLEDRYKSLIRRKERLSIDKAKVDQELASRKKSLKETLEACKAAGFNPDTLEDDIKKSTEVLSLKLDAYEKDLDSADQILSPMVQDLG